MAIVAVDAREEAAHHHTILHQRQGADFSVRSEIEGFIHRPLGKVQAGQAHPVDPIDRQERATGQEAIGGDRQGLHRSIRIRPPLQGLPVGGIHAGQVPVGLAAHGGEPSAHIQAALMQGQGQDLALHDGQPGAVRQAIRPQADQSWAGQVVQAAEGSPHIGETPGMEHAADPIDLEPGTAASAALGIEDAEVGRPQGLKGAAGEEAAEPLRRRQGR